MKLNRVLVLFFIILISSLTLRAQEYKRIISLAQSITNNIYLLGGEHLLVGRTQYCMIAENSHIPVVADAINVNIEKVVSLKPDLVIASGLTHPRVISAIQKMGIRTVQLAQPKNFNELCSQLELLAGYCGEKELAKRYIQENRKRLSQITKSNHPLKIFMFFGSNPLFAVLPDSFMNDYITLLGNKNIFDDLTTGVVSRETVLLRNPDAIIAVSDQQQEIDNWKKYTTLSAVKNNCLFLIDPNKASIATPVDFVDILEEISNTLKQSYTD